MIEAQKIKAENEKKQKEKAYAYKRLFATDDGKIVKEDLDVFCNKWNSCVNEQYPNALQTHFNLGKRRVLLRIEGFLRKEEKND